ncbi:DUF7674 family protein [Zooshikella ganghwensis]|uniref:DUF7674 domain-containing protein n=1 Tax=Zooshikella ganghwensis TaxID=202772 RepID=A0A4P9VUD8_9GAMM|nr:hypothetical protein [Zooshikella ganghwensis]RDH45932.1 hypothetical protein B9G39_22120 [Zooshikella ganghwensis]
MSQSEFVYKLLSVCGGISSRWAGHLEFWEGEEAGHYNDMAVIVSYVVDSRVNNATDEFEVIFAIVEDAVNSSIRDTSELAIIGFLEGILLVGSHKGLTSKDFNDWLGVASNKSILELEQYFEGNT